MGVPFECDLCSFRNMCGRDPIWQNRKDQFTLTCIRRVSLDAFWAREPRTVASNWARSKADYDHDMVVDNLSVPPEALLPQLGNPRLEDRVGMALAVTTVCTSLRPGKNSTHIQFDTMRKTRTWLSNAHDAGREYSCESVLGFDNAKQYITNGKTDGRWFDRVMRGARLRMGMVRRQNEALTSVLALAVCHEAELIWGLPSTPEDSRAVLENTVGFMLVAMCGGLRGEEVPLLSLEGMLTFWEDTSREDDPYLMLTLKGRFKGEVDERWHLVPVSDYTRSMIPLRRWMQRILDRRVLKEGRRVGWLFQSAKGVRDRFGMYDATFRQLIDAVREESGELLPEVVDTEDFSLWRSPRRGAVLETTNQDVSEKVIELINRWRSKESARGSVAGLPMRQVYTQVKSTVPTMLVFSKAL